MGSIHQVSINFLLYDVVINYYHYSSHQGLYHTHPTLIYSLHLLLSIPSLTYLLPHAFYQQIFLLARHFTYPSKVHQTLFFQILWHRSIIIIYSGLKLIWIPHKHHWPILLLKWLLIRWLWFSSLLIFLWNYLLYFCKRKTIFFYYRIKTVLFNGKNFYFYNLYNKWIIKTQ
jgi:hypothetical protein